MMTFRKPLSHKHLSGYMRVRSRRGNWLAVVLLRVSRRDLFYCLTALLIFCLGSVFYQLNGGAPKVLLDVGYYLGRFADGHGSLAPRALPFPSQVVYNRVGKCGSRTIVQLLRMLVDRHRFTLISSDIHNKTRLTKREQRRGVSLSIATALSVCHVPAGHGSVPPSSIRSVPTDVCERARFSTLPANPAFSASPLPRAEIK
ncbi:uronyl 2-sulfotransferase-like [Sinocyclocheilus rhinocerous]|uniref:uronyl 2-sulfotransferase-like n=1 Tax=Sinocyclocheilus rhinocerous TaxID=307959 RepID=UPI0007B8DC48|nr:PREDICTED: uronyl 2-sulfotransferase-like [Sinocyclocheilus rhinocerous]